MMSNIEVDFSVIPAKTKCKVCGKEEEILPQKNVSETMKAIKLIEERHKNCVPNVEG